MDKYINATALLEQMPEVPYKGSVRRILMQAPAADVAPVRRGRWEKNNDGIMIWWECSECHHDAWYDKENLFNYCPNCGARMDRGR